MTLLAIAASTEPHSPRPTGKSIDEDPTLS